MAITNLAKLIKNMNPELIDKGFVFCTVSQEKFDELDLNPIMTFKEKEGITLIIKKEIAEEKSLSYEGEWDMITLNVNSDLEAVGFLAKITKALAEAEISVNAVSAYYHDHLFVPSTKSEKALNILKNLSNQ